MFSIFKYNKNQQECDELKEIYISSFKQLLKIVDPEKKINEFIDNNDVSRLTPKGEEYYKNIEQSFYNNMKKKHVTLFANHGIEIRTLMVELNCDVKYDKLYETVISEHCKK